jgi:antitoxin MazE
MKVNVVKIGNSRGIRIPKAVLKQAGLVDQAELRVVGDTIIIERAKRTREGWEAAAADCRLNGDDSFDDWDATTQDFEGEWE